VTFHRLQIFKLVYNLYSLRIAYCDLEPRNVAQMDGDEFLLIDFMESRMHWSKKCVAQNVCHLVVDSHCIYELTFE
jgi:hypothetical protein